MGAPAAAPAASSSDVDRPTKNSVPELHETPHIISSGRLSGSPEESNTKTQKPHDAIFTYRRELNTSLWKIWMATILFLQIKANGIWRVRNNATANHEYGPHPPAQFLTTNLHVAEFPQTWILLIHLQSLFPNCPWCPGSYRLHFHLRPDDHLLQLPPRFSLRTLLPSWLQHSNRDKVQIGTALIPEKPSSIASSRSSLATLPPKSDVIPTSSSVVIIILNIEWRG